MQTNQAKYYTVEYKIKMLLVLINNVLNQCVFCKNLKIILKYRFFFKKKTN